MGCTLRGTKSSRYIHAGGRVLTVDSRECSILVELRYSCSFKLYYLEIITYLPTFCYTSHQLFTSTAGTRLDYAFLY